MAQRKSGVELSVDGLSKYLNDLTKASDGNQKFIDSIGKGGSLNFGNISAALGDAGKQGASSFADAFKLGFALRVGGAVFDGLVTAAQAAGRLAGQGFQAAFNEIKLDIKIGAEFQQATADVSALANITNKLDQSKIQEATSALAIDPSVVASYKDVSQAQLRLLQSGETLNEVLGKREEGYKGTARAALLLQNASGGSVDTASITLAKYQRIFGLTADTAEKSASIIAGTTRTAALRDLNDYLLLLTNSTSGIETAHVSQLDFAASIATSSAAFSRGRTEGTAYTAFINSLTPKTDKAAGALEKLGIDGYDAAGNFIPLADLLKQIYGLQNKATGSTRKLTEEQRNLYLQQAFGVTGSKFVIALLETSTYAQFQNNKQLIDAANVAEQAKIKTNTLKAAYENLGDTLETLRGGFAIGEDGRNNLLDELTTSSRSLQVSLQAVIPNARKLGSNLADALKPAFDAIPQMIAAISGEPFLIDLSNVKFGAVNGRVNLQLGDIFTFDQTVDTTFVSLLNGALQYAADQAYVAISIGDVFSLIGDKVSGALTIQLGQYTVTYSTAELETALMGFSSYIQSIPTRLVEAFSFAPKGVVPGNAIPPGTNEVAKPAISGIEPFLAYVKALPNQISLAFTGLTLPDVAQQIKDKVTALFPADFSLSTITFPNLAQKIKDKIAELLPTTFSLTDITFPDVGKLLTDSIGKLIPADFNLNTVFPEAVSQGLTDLTNGLGLFGGAITLADMALKEVAGDDSGLSRLRTFVEGFAHTISDTLTNIDPAKTAALGGAISTTFVTITNALTDLAGIGNANIATEVKVYTDVLKGVLDFATGVTNGIKGEDIGGAAAGFASALIDKFSTAIGSANLPGIATSASNFVLAISNQFENAIGFNQLSGVGKSLGSFVNTLVDQFSKVLTNPKFGANLGQSFANFVVGITAGASSLLKGFAEATDQDVGITDKIGTAVGTFVSNFLAGISRELATAHYGALVQALIQGMANSLLNLTGTSGKQRDVAQTKAEVAQVTADKKIDDARRLAKQIEQQGTPATPEQQKQLTTANIEATDTSFDAIAKKQSAATKNFLGFFGDMLLGKFPGITTPLPGKRAPVAGDTSAGPILASSPESVDANNLLSQVVQNAGKAITISQKDALALVAVQSQRNVAIQNELAQTTDAVKRAALNVGIEQGSAVATSLQSQALNAPDAKGNVIIQLPESLGADALKSAIQAATENAAQPGFFEGLIEKILGATATPAKASELPPANEFSDSLSALTALGQLATTLNAQFATVQPAAAPLQGPTPSGLPLNMVPTANDLIDQLDSLRTGAAAAGTALQEGATNASSVIATSAAIVSSGAAVAGATLAATPPFPGWGTILGPPVDLAARIPAFPGWNAFITGVNLNNKAPTMKDALGFAGGTPYVPRTGAYVVGENGAEVVMLQRGNSVIPNHMLGKIQGGYAAGTPDAHAFIDAAAARSKKPIKIDVDVTVDERKKGDQMPVGNNFLGPDAFAPRSGDFSPQPTPAAGISENKKSKIEDDLLDTTNAIKTSAINFSGTLDDLNSELKNVPGLFGASPVTQEQLDAAKAGVPQNFADDFVRRLGAEVANGNQEFGGLLPQAIDALNKIGVTPGGSPDAVLAQIKDTFASGRLFANPENLGLINADAVKASIAEQDQAKTGQQNIQSFFDQMFGFATNLSGAGGLAQPSRSNKKDDTGDADQAEGVPFPGWQGQGGVIPNFPNWTGKGGVIENFPGWGKPNGFVPELDWGEFIDSLGSDGTETTPPPTAPATPEVPAKARGSNNFPGGSVITGENGRELSVFPAGTRIFPANQTGKILSIADTLARGMPGIYSDPMENFRNGTARQLQTQVIYQRQSNSQTTANNTRVYNLNVRSEQNSSSLARDFQYMQVVAG